MKATARPRHAPSNCRECLHGQSERFDTRDCLTIDLNRNKSRQSFQYLDVQSAHTQPESTTLTTAFLAEASAIYGLVSASHSKNEIPSRSKAGKEYRDRRDSNDCGRRLGSLSLSLPSRKTLSASRIGTPCFLNIRASALIRSSIFDIPAFICILTFPKLELRPPFSLTFP